MSRALMSFFTFIFRILFNLTKRIVFQNDVRGHGERRSDDAPRENDDAEEPHHMQQSEDEIRRYIPKLPTLKQRNMYQSLWCHVPYKVPSGPSDYSNLVEEYQNTIFTLKGQCDEQSRRIIRGDIELRRLKCALMRTQRSHDNLRRTLGTLEAECGEIACQLLGATETARSQACTIEGYERLCCHLVAELENVIGQHKAEPLASHTFLGFVSHTLSEVVKVKSHFGIGEHELDLPRLIAYDHRCIRDPSTSVCYAGVQADFSVGESVGTQTCSSVGESVGVQTDSSVGESIGVQTDFSVGLQTEYSVGASIGVQTEYSVGESIGVQTEHSVGESIGVQTNTCFHQTVGVQTCFDGEGDLSEIASGQEDYAPMQDIVAELLEKFGHDTRWTTSHYKQDVLLVKIQKHGFQSLLFPELAFLHRKIGAHSAKLFEKYKPLLDLAKMKFSSLRSSTIRYKYDIVHIFSTLDTVLEIKNKELASLKTNFTKNRNKFKTLLDEQTQKRISAENKILEIRSTNERLIKRNRP